MAEQRRLRNPIAQSKRRIVELLNGKAIQKLNNSSFEKLLQSASSHLTEDLQLSYSSSESYYYKRG